MKSSKPFVLEKSKMKTNQLFEHEMSVVSTAEKVSAKIGAAIKYDDFNLILAEYKKLLKTTSRLVRHSDRMETNLNISAKEAREKSEQLCLKIRRSTLICSNIHHRKEKNYGIIRLPRTA